MNTINVKKKTLLVTSKEDGLEVAFYYRRHTIW